MDEKWGKKIKFIIIQNGWRINIFEDINVLSNDYSLDDMFFFNKNISNLYSKFIKGNTHYLGSFVNNYFNPDTEVKKSEKKSILFISISLFKFFCSENKMSIKNLSS